MPDPEENAEPVVEDAEPVVEEQEEPKLNKTQLQQISSVMGSIIKKAIEKDVLPLVNERRETEAVLSPTQTDNPAYEKFNERLSQKMYSGDIAGALQDYLNVHEKANQNLTKKQQTDLNKDISSHQEKPHYKDVFPEMDKMAKEFVANGYPTGPAADLAYEKSVNSFLMNRGQDNSASLAMETGGRRTVTPSTGKLPPQFEKAYQQGKDKGLFTDRKDYVANLDPRVRSQYGIE